VVSKLQAQATLRPVATDIHTTEVDLSGLMTVLGSHLYSTPSVAIRELVQNAHDSISRRRIEDPEFGGGEGRIELHADPARGMLVVRDDGAGMTRDEVRQFLATIGVGYTRELRERSHAEELIGMFGLGFLSAFIIAARTTVRTTSYQSPGETVEYRSTSGERYTLGTGPSRPVGTEVELQLADDHRVLADPGALEATVARYCRLLDVPVSVNGGEPVNADPPPWRDAGGPVTEHPAQRHRRRREFAEAMDRFFAPVCFVDVAPEGESDAQGLLWVQDAATYGGSDNRQVAVYVRGMLVDDDARNLLPRWAGFVTGVIESRSLTPTASREDVQRDSAYESVRAHLHETLVSGLAAVAREQPEAWARVLRRHNEALLGAALSDERIEGLVAEDLHVPTSDGDMTVRELVRAGGGRAHVGLGDGGFEEMRFRALKVPIALGTRYAVLPFLRRWCRDRGVELVEIGTEKGDSALFRRVTIDEEDARWLASELAGPGHELIPAAFEPAAMPFVLVPDREAELKRLIEADEAEERIASAALHLARMHTAGIDGERTARLYVNVEAPAISALLEARRRGADPAAATGLLRAVLALIAAGERGAGRVDLEAALDDITAAVRRLCEG
jgi:molecular chaperone HtpG